MKKSVLITFILTFAMSTFMTSCSNKDAPEITQGHLIRFYSDGLKLKEIRVKEGSRIKIGRNNNNITYTTPEKEGYEFLGWLFNGKTFDFNTVVDTSMDLVASWRKKVYTISFFETLEGRKLNEIKVKYKKVMNEKDIENPSRSHHEFLGWLSSSEKAFDFSAPILKNANVYANWIKKHQITILLYFKGPAVTTVSVRDGVFLKNLFSSNTKREDYEFVRWETISGEFNPNQPIKEDFVIYGKWLKLFTVQFKTDGGIPPVPKKTIAKGLHIQNPKALTKKGFSFERWVDENGFSFIFDTPIVSDITLKAVWKQNDKDKVSFNLTYDYNYKNAPSVRIVSFLEKELVKESSFPPQRESYKFVEWRHNGQAFTFGRPITEDIRLEAAWVLNKTKKYTVTYDNSYTGAPAPKVVTIPKGNFINKLLPNPTRDGYRFVEWRYNEQAFTFGRPIMADTILMAFWEVDKVVPTVTFITGNGGPAVTPKHPDDKGKVSPPKSNPEKENYIFIKWQKADKDFDFENTIVDKDITLTAVWMEKEKYEEVKDIVEPTKYQNERESGAPSRPTWIDAFRHYPELDFYKKGRYLLVWRKDPGDTAKPASRWEVQMITFKNPGEIRDKKFGKIIDPFDVKETKVIYTEDNPKLYTADETVTLPGNLLLPDRYSTDSSVNYAARSISLAASSQLGYIGITRELTNGANRHAVVAYKVRAYAKTKNTDDFGQDIEVEVYNDSPVIMVSYAQGKSVQITSTGGGNSGGGSVTKKAIPDELTSRTDVSSKLKLSAGKYFVSSWENRKLTGETPIEKLITKEDYKALFPSLPEKIVNAHDKDMKYYSWENLVEASRYFPKFLNEGSLEDKYRELAAFFGNKSHETGDGWVSMGVNRWKCGLWWIVELRPLAGQDKTDPNYLYNAYSESYTSPGHAIYPPVEGKSYHGRGPLQVSWNYNYGRISQQLFGDKSILLNNPNLLAREGLYGWASAIWFWMEPQDDKPSCHDVMVGNLRLSTPYTVPTSRINRTARTHLSTSIGSDAAGNTVDYKDYRVPAGAEIGFGMTINIINGGMEANTGSIDNRQARRIGYYARYLDYFGTIKAKIGRPISPEVSNGDSVPTSTIEAMKGWKNWIYLPEDGSSPNGLKDFPKDDIPSILSSRWQSSF